MKKLLALLLAVMMVISMAACNNAPAAATDAPTDAPVVDPTDAPTEPPVVEEATYTYNYAMSEFPSTWNPHTYQTATDAEILDYASVGFYSFDYNDTIDGYKVVPEMATDFPTDVTADYVGKYGIAEGDTAKVYIIPLRDDLKWEDGTPITAQDFVESAKRLLNPEAGNYRADTLYSGNMVIYNAEAYSKGGKYAYSNMISGDDEYVLIADMVANDAGQFTVDGQDVWFNMYDGGNWSSNSLDDYYNAGYSDLFIKDDVDLWTDVFAPAANEEGYVAVTQEIADALCHIIAGLHGFADAEAYAADSGDYAYQEWEEFCFYGADAPLIDWADVGMFALSDTELGIAITKPLEGFYLYYSLTSSWLVKNDLYDSLTSVVDGIYTNTYGTSVETTMSYGPYKLTSFQADKQFILERNEYFYGLTEDTYQTTKLVCDCVDEPATRLQLFLEGKLDTYGLTADDMETYSLSDYCYYATGDSTFAICFDPDMDALVSEQEKAGENINKTILTILEFRMAMSFALDRAAFCLATSPTNSAAFGLYSTSIISDPDAGIPYRNTDVAKETLAKFWGVSEEYGEGKLYADIDEAIESITGYNLTKAQEMFNVAYDKAIEAGLMDEDDVVEIKIGTPNNTSKFYNNGYEFLVNNYTEAVKGTKLEGKLQFTRDDTLGNGFSDALKNNQVDMLFGVGWTGSALDPYGLMEAYVKPSYQYDESTDFTAIDLTIAIDGVEYTASVWDWYCVMAGEVTVLTDAEGNTIEYSCGTADKDPETRLQILGAMEEAVLLNYNFVPIMDDSSAQLKGQQIEYYTEDYIFGMGFGGIKYFTYNYTDAEWDEYVASQNSMLDYK